jgi:16S rRNA G966 N2-methylase RsmD
MEIKSKDIKVTPIGSLVYNPKNNNKHPEDQINRLAELIKYQGFRNPIVVSVRTGYVIAGHGRIEAAKKIGLKEVPVMFQDFENEAQEYAYLTSDNAIAAWAELDLSMVNTEMLDLGPDFDIDLLGIKDFVIEPIEKFEPQSDEDAVPDVVHPITRKADVWLLGNHRLMCGDSTMIDDVEKLMNGEKADMVFTDPPYGVSYLSNMRTKSDKFEVIKNDDVILDICPIIEMYSRGFVFIWTTWKVLDKWLDNTQSLGFPSNMVVWSKGGGGIGDLKKTFSTDWELALVWHRGCELTGKRIGSVWSVGKDKAIDYKHPTQKPVALAEEALDKVTKTGYKILDLFGGSGSTLIACEKMSRKSYNMELDEKYCDVIINRWQNYTGKKATLELTGQTYEELKVERDG